MERADDPRSTIPEEVLPRLLETAASGDESARSELCRWYAAPLAQFVRRISGPGLLRFASVDEICQETFLRVFPQIGALPSTTTPAEFHNRLLRNARWIVHDFVRRSRDFVGESAATRAPRSPVPGFDDGAPRRTGPVTQGDELEGLRRLVHRLRPEYAEVIRLRLCGMDFSSIARELDCREDTARKRYSRAVDLLRELLRDRGTIDS